jgi:hypothetical protein
MFRSQRISTPFLLLLIIALVIATPLAVAVALFITHYAPRRLAQGLGYVIDLLAAVPGRSGSACSRRATSISGWS